MVVVERCWRSRNHHSPPRLKQKRVDTPMRYNEKTSTSLHSPWETGRTSPICVVGRWTGCGDHFRRVHWTLTHCWVKHGLRESVAAFRRSLHSTNVLRFRKGNRHLRGAEAPRAPEMAFRRISKRAKRRHPRIRRATWRCWTPVNRSLFATCVAGHSLRCHASL